MGTCEDSAPFALRVTGTSMEPEFFEGEIIIVEPDGLVKNGSFVVANHRGEWVLRQLLNNENGDGFILSALNPAFPEMSITSLSDVRGVVIQKSIPGQRKRNKRYV